MKQLKEFINEQLITEAAPTFTNDMDGIKAFCDYVYDPNFVKYVVNPDLTITLFPVNPAPNDVNNLYLEPKDLKEIPDFIEYSNIPTITLGISWNKKLKRWAPKVKGTCAGVVIANESKLQELDLTNCDCKGGQLYIEKCGDIKKIVGGKGDGVKVYIRKNKSLTHLDLRGFKNCMDPGSYVSKNKNLKDISMIPSEVEID